MSELVEHCRSRFALIGDDGDTLEVLEPLPDLDVDVDPVQIDQVLTNLIENSVRHAQAPVHVTVSAAERDAMVEWRVCDDGPGFSADGAGGACSSRSAPPAGRPASDSRSARRSSKRMGAP